MIPLTHWGLGIAVFGVFLGLHILLWNRAPSLRSLRMLISLVFVASLSLFFAGLSALEWIAPLVMYASISASYLAIYPAFSAESPSLVMLRELRRHAEGLTQQQLCGEWESQQLRGRLEELKSGGLIIETDSGVRLSWTGNLLAGLFVRYRKLLGLPVGEG